MKMSRPFDVHRWADYPKLRNCISELVAELENAEPRKRARRAKAQKQFRDALRCLVLDLYVARNTDPDLLIGVSRGKKWFLDTSRYASLFLNYHQFKAAFEGLRNQGYLEVVHEGFNDRRSGTSRTTRIRATSKLIHFLEREAKLTTAYITKCSEENEPETIILKDKDKKQIEYTDNDLTQKMRNDLRRINAALAKHWIDLELSDDDFSTLQVRMRANGESSEGPIDFTAKHLYRVFNNSAWTDGGRFYGGWWQNIPKKYRKFITINGKETREVDYSRLHPHMLYAGIDAEMPEDAYHVPGLNAHEGLVKRTFNKLLNAQGRITIDDEFDQARLGLSWDDFLTRLTEHHAPINKFLRTGHGIKLQRQDADIANAIMCRFLEMNYVCLPVHDSFIVHKSLQDELESIMVEEFKKMFKSKISYKIKSRDNYTPPNDGHVDHHIALGEAFGLEGKFKGYNQRRLNWEIREPSGVVG